MGVLTIITKSSSGVLTYDQKHSSSTPGLIIGMFPLIYTYSGGQDIQIPAIAAIAKTSPGILTTNSKN